MLPGGTVIWGDRALNLHEPGTALALVDEAGKAGWHPHTPEPVELDGWTLFDAVHTRRLRRGSAAGPLAHP